MWIFYRIQYKLRDFKYYIKNIFHLLKYGYPKNTTWSLDHYLVPILYKSFKAFKESDRGGSPCFTDEETGGMTSGDYWENILQEIDEGMECGMKLINEDYWDERKKSKKEIQDETITRAKYIAIGKAKEKMGERFNEFCMPVFDTERTFNEEKYKELNKKFEKSMTLLGKFIFYMWD